MATLANNFALASAAFRDGDPSDLIAISNATSATNDAMILLGNADAGVVAQNPFSLPGGSASAVAADFDGDGKQDLTVRGRFLEQTAGNFGRPSGMRTGGPGGQNITCPTSP